MDATSIFIIGILVAGVLAAAGIFAVAARRKPTDGPVTAEELDKRARAADEARAKRPSRLHRKVPAPVRSQLSPKPLPRLRSHSSPWNHHPIR